MRLDMEAFRSSTGVINSWQTHEAAQIEYLCGKAWIQISILCSINFIALVANIVFDYFSSL